MLKAENNASEVTTQKGSLPVVIRIKVEVNFVVDLNLAKRLQALFPAYEFVASSWGSTESLHPILHCERIVKETEALKLCKGFIVDIGGNPQRHSKFNRKIWSMCPRLTAADNHRHSKLEDSNVFTYCECTAPEFGDDCCCSKANSFLSVDSLYYLDPASINEIVQIADLVAVVHDFSKSQGSYYEESRYSINPEGIVDMTVNGSSISYRHSAMGWMRGASSYWNDQSDTGMTWYLIKSVGSSLIYKFLRADRKIASDPMSLQVALTNKESYSSPCQIDGTQLSKVLGDTSLVVLPWGSTVVVRWGSVIVTVPKRIVAAARMASVYTQRTPDQFQVVVRKVKERVERDELIAENDKPDVVVIASALGFVADIDREISCLDSVQSELSGKYNHHSSALTFDLKGTSRTTALAAVTFTGAAAGVVALRNPELGFRGLQFAGYGVLTSPWWLKIIVVSSLLTGVISNPRVQRGLMKSLGSVQARDHGSLVKGGSAGGVTLPAYQSARASMTPMEGASFKFSYAWRKIRTKGAQLCGLGLACCVPVVSSDDPLNEERAIIHRTLNTKGRAVPGLWADVLPILRSVLPPTIVRAASFEVWNSRFPKVRQAAQKKALDEFQSCPDIVSVRSSCVRKAFLKREKLLKSSPTGVDDFDPRVIQGTNNLPNALLGPWMYSFSKHLARTWSTSFHVTYAPGLSAEQVGAWMAQCEAEGFSSYLATDFSRFDASICVEALEVEQQLYEDHGVGKWAQVVLKEQLYVKGKSSHGHRYRVFGTRCSGDPNTSCGNGTLDAGALMFTLGRLGVVDYRIIVSGDDSVIALKTGVDREAFVNTLALLGFSAKTILHSDPDRVEFCSGYFWRTELGRVWGPKIGRVLAKTGYSVNVQHNPRAWLKGVLVGMSQDSAHVPLLTVYVSHCLSLLSDVKTVAKTDDHKFHVGKKHKASPETYQQFYKIYSLDPEQLDTMKNEILSIKTLPHLLGHPFFEVLVNVDV